MTIQLRKVQLIPGGVMKHPGKTNKFSPSNKKVLTGPFPQIEITKIDNFASFFNRSAKKKRLIILKLKTWPEQLDISKPD